MQQQNCMMRVRDDGRCPTAQAACYLATGIRYDIVGRCCHQTVCVRESGGPAAKLNHNLPAQERGGSDGDYHNLGYAKTDALIGKAFAEATLEMQDK